MLILVMGVRGVGKTPLAQELASVIGYRLIDSSELYSDSLLRKIKNKEQPDESEQREFLLRVKAASLDALTGMDNVVLSFSALLESDRREVLGQGDSFQIVYI